MRPFLLKAERPPFSDTVWLNAMAAVAIGMFIGHWVIGPAINYGMPNREPLRSATLERQALDEASARPDPSPYRTPTPAFETSNAPSYAAAAKHKAQAPLGWRGAQSLEVPDAFGALRDPEPAPQPSRARSYDRHTGIRY